MNQTRWQKAWRIIAATFIMLGWPAVVIAQMYFTTKMPWELSMCTPIENHSRLWGPTALLALAVFALSSLRVIVGPSPWRFIDHTRTILLTGVLLWAGFIGGLLVLVTYAVPRAWFGDEQIWLATTGLTPVVQTLAAIIAIRRTEHWTTKKRILLLAALTLALPTLWIASTETLSALIC